MYVVAGSGFFSFGGYSCPLGFCSPGGGYIFAAMDSSHRWLKDFFGCTLHNQCLEEAQRYVTCGRSDTLLIGFEEVE